MTSQTPIAPLLVRADCQDMILPTVCNHISDEKRRGKFLIRSSWSPPIGYMTLGLPSPSLDEKPDAGGSERGERGVEEKNVHTNKTCQVPHSDEG